MDNILFIFPMQILTQRLSVTQYRLHPKVIVCPWSVMPEENPSIDDNLFETNRNKQADNKRLPPRLSRRKSLHT